MATPSPEGEMLREPCAARALVVAIGNPLRGDDAVAHRIVESLGAVEGVVVRQEQQLTPELAAEFSAFATAVFIDADANAGAVSLERLDSGGTETGSHHRCPASVVTLATELYGWDGTALVCRVPAEAFEAGAPLSPTAAAGSRVATTLLASYLRS